MTGGEEECGSGVLCCEGEEEEEERREVEIEVGEEDG